MKANENQVKSMAKVFKSGEMVNSMKDIDQITKSYMED